MLVFSTASHYKIGFEKQKGKGTKNKNKTQPKTTQMHVTNITYKIKAWIFPVALKYSSINLYSEYSLRT